MTGTRSPDDIERKVVRRVRGGERNPVARRRTQEFGADRSRTVEASDRLISKYKSEGYEFVTVPEMMAKTKNDQGPISVGREYRKVDDRPDLSRALPGQSNLSLLPA